MNARAKGKEEIAYNRFCHDIEKFFIEAEGSGVRLDDLLYYAHGFVIRRMDPPLLATAIKESAFELRLRREPHSGEPPSQDEIQAGRVPSQESTGENQGYPNGPVKAANSNPKGNRLFPEGCRKMAMAAVLEDLFEAGNPATEGCAAVQLLLEYVRPTAEHFCNRSDTPWLHPAAKRQGSCHEGSRTNQPSRKYMNYQFPCSILRLILDLMRAEKQDTGDAARRRHDIQS